MGVGVGTAEKLVSEGGIEYRQQWGGDVCSVPIHGVDRIDPALFASRNEVLRSGLDAAEARCREQVGGNGHTPKLPAFWQRNNPSLNLPVSVLEAVREERAEKVRERSNPRNRPKPSKR